MSVYDECGVGECCVLVDVWVCLHEVVESAMVCVV